MMANLAVRLVRNIRFLRWFLFLIGLPDNSPGRFYWMKRTWTAICLFLALQAHVYIFIHRCYRYMDYLLFSKMDNLMAVLDRLVRLFGPVMLHIFLLQKLERIFLTLCRKLEEIDSKLNRPDLTILGLFSTVGIITIAVAVNEFTIFFYHNCGYCTLLIFKNRET